MPNWIDNPRYQRLVQKLQAMSQWQRAIFSTAGADRAFAGEGMRNKINAIDAATRKKAIETNVSLSERRLDLNRDSLKASKRLADKRRGIETEDMRLGEYLGYGNVALSGLLGYKEMELAELRAARERDDRMKILEYMRR